MHPGMTLYGGNAGRHRRECGRARQTTYLRCITTGSGWAGAGCPPSVRAPQGLDSLVIGSVNFELFD